MVSTTLLIHKRMITKPCKRKFVFTLNYNVLSVQEYSDGLMHKILNIKHIMYPYNATYGTS